MGVRGTGSGGLGDRKWGAWGGHEVGFGGGGVTHSYWEGVGGGDRGASNHSQWYWGGTGGGLQSIHSMGGEGGVEYGEGGAQPLLMAQGWYGGVTIALNGTE